MSNGTGGGVTAGIDFALILAAELTNPMIAQSLQLGFEYARARPSALALPNVPLPMSWRGSVVSMRKRR